MSSPSNHFFKFIPPGFKYNVSIPRSLSTKLNRGGCKKVILRRGRREWLVDISDGGVFGDGWRKFVTDNGVQEFDFIVFKHQGNMVFDFTVFDQSACERQYQSLYDEMDVEESLTDHTHKRLKKLKKCERNDYSTKKEDKFQLDDDRCFMTIMTAYYIKSSRVHVPMKFARSNGLFTDRGHRQIVIMDEALRTCQATVEIRTDQFRLRGWRELIIKNHFKAGDTCMFELVKHGEVPVIIIYYLGKKPVDNNIKVKKEGSSTIKKETTTSTVKNHRHFTSTLKPCTFKKSCLYLPVEFSMANGLKAGEMILRDNKGRSWEVKLKRNGEKHFYLGCGLKAFCYANGLKEGDECKFELVENEIGKPPVVNFSSTVSSSSLI